MFEHFLSAGDALRVLDVYTELARHHIDSWALTGGLALEIHALRLGVAPRTRSLNDLDFVAAHFTDVPTTLAKHFCFRHVHPEEIPGRLMMQFVDIEAKLRIDLFRSVEAGMSRVEHVTLPTGEAKILAIEDLVARTARVCLDIVDEVPIPVKHAEDFLRFADVPAPLDVQVAWIAHRKPAHPLAFDTVRDLLLDLIPKRRDLLELPQYSKEVGEECPRCIATADFPLVDPAVVLSALGYC